MKPTQKTLLIAGLAGLTLLLTRKGNPSLPNNIPSVFNGEPIRGTFAAESQNVIGKAGYSFRNWQAVAKMETAGFTSSLYKNANNPWGMKVAVIRPHFQKGAYVSGGVFNWASYDDLNQACRDIVAWCDYTKFPKGDLSLEAHVAAMGARNYFGNETVSSYLSKVRAWLKK